MTDDYTGTSLRRAPVITLAALCMGVATMGCQQDRAPEAGTASVDLTAFEPLPTEAPVFEGNPATVEKVALGKMLYFDPRLSRSWLISCNTCHNVGLGGVDLMETSVGHGWQKGPRNAPTVLNAVFNIAQFWDGRAADLEEQAKGPVQAAVEMSNTPDRVLATLTSIPQYVEQFARAFPDEENPLTFDNVAKAIEVYEATLLTPGSRFDQYLKGTHNALTEEERAGLAVFVQSGCSGCHNGVNLGGNGYFPFGVRERPSSDILPPGDKGRFAVTRTPNDEYVFRAPTLRNVALTAPYFHSGRVWRLEDAVSIMGSAQLGTDLSLDQVAEITAFLGALTGEQPVTEYPVLPPHTPETPRPDIGVGEP